MSIWLYSLAGVGENPGENAGILPDDAIATYLMPRVPSKSRTFDGLDSLRQSRIARMQATQRRLIIESAEEPF